LLGAKGVDGGVGALAHIDGVFEEHGTGVVFAVGEKQDDVAAGDGIDFAELVEAGSIDGVEDGCAGGVAFSAGGDSAKACDEFW